MPVIDKDVIERISRETEAALVNKDEAGLLKYIHPTSCITIQGKRVTYDEYRGLLKMTFQALETADVNSEQVSLFVDHDRNIATLETKTVAIMRMMGMTVKDTSLNRTTYGVIDGEVKVIESEDTAISSEVLE
ncbi:hypothetical protein [Aliamphritea hakodatensis]|uniref:hypothetical protein n=1 Tax=Aliamphritea hakodatensis TaxID=2895352 RepID=UPI0022FD47DD|nr:hypothetical protein [Aliamphritea hakodatensis]